MNKKYVMLMLLFSTLCVSAQQIRFYASNGVKFLKANNDSLQMPFTGGFNAPQFSNIDLNNDGLNDLFIFDRGNNKITTLVKTNTGYKHAPEFEGKFPFANDWCLLRDFDADGKPDLFTEITFDRKYLRDTIRHVQSNGLRLYRNKSNATEGLKFTLLNNQERDTGGFWKDFGVYRAPDNVATTNIDIPGIGDIDGDGDDDIFGFISNDLSPVYYENFVKNKYNIQYKTDSTRFILRDQCWGYMQYDAPSFRNRFRLGLGKQDIGSCMFQMYEKHARHAGTTLCILDYNGDGIQDVVYGDFGFKNMLLLTNGRNLNSLGRDSIIAQDTAFPSNTTPINFILFPAAYYVDYDGDGKRDLLVSTNDHVSSKSVNNVWRYRNTATDAKPVFQYVGNDFVGYSETVDLGTRSVPVLIDIDSDGDKDLLVATNGDYELTNNLKDRLVLYRNTPESGRSVFKLADTNFLNLSSPFPIINMHPAVADLDGDGKEDLILGDESGNLRFYKNLSVGTTYNFQFQSSSLDAIDVGSYAAPTFADINKDGLLDIIVGNRDGVLQLFLNRGSATNPTYNATTDKDTFGGITTRYSYISTYGDVTYEAFGFAAPFAYDLNGDGNTELIVGSQSGRIYIYTNVDTVAGRVFTLMPESFVNYSNGNQPNEVRLGTRSAPCVGLMDGDSKPDVLVGNLSGGLLFFGSIDINPTSGIKDISTNQLFQLYPNPANGMVTIKHDRIDVEAIYIVYDQSGRMVTKGNINPYHAETSLDISQLEAGFYFIHVSTQATTHTQKLIINKN